MTKEEARELGKIVKRARRNRKLTLRAVGEASKVSYTWLGRLERGEMAAPAPSKLRRLADALSIAPEQIDRIVRVSGDLPSIRTYLRTKYHLSSEEITKIEDVFDRVRREHPDHETLD